jgi:hypothetical protein
MAQDFSRLRSVARERGDLLHFAAAACRAARNNIFRRPELNPPQTCALISEGCIKTIGYEHRSPGASGFVWLFVLRRTLKMPHAATAEEITAPAEVPYRPGTYGAAARFESAWLLSGVEMNAQPAPAELTWEYHYARLMSQLTGAVEAMPLAAPS